MRDNSNFDTNGMPHMLKIHQYPSQSSSNTSKKLFFINCLVIQRPTLGYCRGHSITHPRLGCKDCPSQSMGSKPDTSYFQADTLSHCATLLSLTPILHKCTYLRTLKKNRKGQSTFHFMVGLEPEGGESSLSQEEIEFVESIFPLSMLFLNVTVSS